MDKGCKEKTIQKKATPKKQGHKSPSKPPLKKNKTKIK
jgi:hypothetical protein